MQLHVCSTVAVRRGGCVVRRGSSRRCNVIQCNFNGISMQSHVCSIVAVCPGGSGSDRTSHFSLKNGVGSDLTSHFMTKNDVRSDLTYHLCQRMMLDRI
jgi:hypothetical protein